MYNSTIHRWGIFIHDPKHAWDKIMSILAETSWIKECPTVVGHQEWLSSRRTEELLKCLQAPGQLLVLFHNCPVAPF